MELRDYQNQAITDVYRAWAAGAQNVLLQLSTGSGKTVNFCKIIADHTLPSVAIVHRVELVSQISLTLGRYGIRHNIIAQKCARREIVGIHMTALGRSYYDPQSRVTVASVGTLLRLPPSTPWFQRVGLVVQDEAAHVLTNNQWGKAAALFPNARGLYPTATPIRADGRGLGRHADGIIDAMVVGIGMRELIRRGYLAEYRIFAPTSDIDLTSVPVAAGGDYSPVPLRTAVHKSHITGDVVANYLRIAPGKLGVTFCVDIEAATETAAAYRAAGVAAEVISSRTPDLLRYNIMQRFRNREIMQLVNVDILGEGVDVPDIEVVSMARPTCSYGLYAQCFGRALRPKPNGQPAIIIDHVGNVLRHGLPDAPRVWSLDRRERRSKLAEDVIPLRVCLNPQCVGVYPRTTRVCPYCGFYSAPVQRSTPAQVDGDLTELDPEVLARLRGEIDRIDGTVRIPQHLDAIAARAVANKHADRQRSQQTLRDTIAQWAGWPRAAGASDQEIYMQFYAAFKIDIASAQTLNARDAENLRIQIQNTIDANGTNTLG